MDQAGFPTILGVDHRILPKDQRTQSHQRAVLLNNVGARTRRIEWINNHQNRISKDSNIIRKRAPKRSREVIEKEKIEKEAKKKAKFANSNSYSK